MARAGRLSPLRLLTQCDCAVRGRAAGAGYSITRRTRRRDSDGHHPRSGEWAGQTLVNLPTLPIRVASPHFRWRQSFERSRTRRGVHRRTLGPIPLGAAGALSHSQHRRRRRRHGRGRTLAGGQIHADRPARAVTRGAGFPPVRARRGTRSGALGPVLEPLRYRQLHQSGGLPRGPGRARAPSRATSWTASCTRAARPTTKANCWLACTPSKPRRRSPVERRSA